MESNLKGCGEKLQMGAGGQVFGVSVDVRGSIIWRDPITPRSNFGESFLGDWGEGIWNLTKGQVSQSESTVAYAVVYQLIHPNEVFQPPQMVEYHW